MAATATQPQEEELMGCTNHFVEAKQPLTYAITGRPAFATVTVFLDVDEQVKGDNGAMVWMDAGVDVSTSCDGCIDAYMRQCSGEGGCINTFTGPGYVTFGFDEPGDILPFGVTPEDGWIIGARTYIAGSTNINVSAKCTGCPACCLGEGLFFTHVTCDDGLGLFFAGGYGEIIRHEIVEGQSLWVNNSLFFAAHESTDISLSLPGSCATCCCGGEGFVMKFDGPCIVYTQSRDPVLIDPLIKAKVNRKSRQKHSQVPNE